MKKILISLVILIGLAVNSFGLNCENISFKDYHSLSEKEKESLEIQKDIIKLEGIKNKVSETLSHGNIILFSDNFSLLDKIYFSETLKYCYDDNTILLFLIDKTSSWEDGSYKTLIKEINIILFEIKVLYKDFDNYFNLIK